MNHSTAGPRREAQGLSFARRFVEAGIDAKPDTISGPVDVLRVTPDDPPGVLACDRSVALDQQALADRCGWDVLIQDIRNLLVVVVSKLTGQFGSA